MRTLFEPGDKVQITNSNLDCHGETGKVTERNSLGHGMYSYVIRIDGEEIEVGGESIDVA